MTRIVLTTVSIADGNIAYRNTVAQNLARCPGLVIFDKCQDAASALEILAQRPPRILLAGDNLADMPKWGFIEALRNLRLPTQVIAVSDSTQIGDIQASFRAGAMGYLLRSTPVPFLQQSLYELINGGAPLSPSIARALVSSYFTPLNNAGPLSDLSTREREVLDMLSRGLKYRQIAIQLQLSSDTVHSHAKNVYRKLNVKSKTEAAMIWMRSLNEQPSQPARAIA